MSNKGKKIAVIFVSILAIIAIALVCIAISNNQKAKEIKDNFIGQNFIYSNKTQSPASGPYTTKWLFEDKKIISFKEDGSVYFSSSYDQTVLSYPKGEAKPKEEHSDYDTTYDSFDVRVTLFGTVYLDLGNSTYVVKMGDNNTPKSLKNNLNEVFEK